MLETLITNKTRLKLLLRLFLNGESSAYLRALESEFNESTNSIRIELNRFEKAGLLLSSKNGRKKIFRANRMHPLYKDINSILRKYIGLDKLIEHIVEKISDIKRAYIIGDIAIGLDTHTIELLLICNHLDKSAVKTYIQNAEKIINKKILYFQVSEIQEELFLENKKDSFLIWDLKQK